MKFKERYLRNTISGVGHRELEEALEYYHNTLKENGFYENPTPIDTLDDLCEVLNHMDVYGCGSSFKMEDWEFVI